MIVTKDNIIHLAESKSLYSDAPVMDLEGKYRELLTDVTFELSNQTLLTIRKGFLWDEASIPWIVQPLFPKSGIHAYASLPHDALYYHTQTSQHFADSEFAYWMLALKIPASQIRWRWWGVEKFGHKRWNRNLNNPRPICLHNRSFISLDIKTTYTKSTGI